MGDLLGSSRVSSQKQNLIRTRETCSPSNTKSIRKDLLDPKGFLIYLYLGFIQSQYVLECMSQHSLLSVQILK
ncbi:hypothetical protein DVH24_007751 [Malus domestica]|uniref:Uncharacterized protein n=1 Tax=Malus domestica TaxID=3750 RepID=A0A498JQI2_MALDO|nr:hypothetical protein DVH24_007751 [Malus domestica]